MNFTITNTARVGVNTSTGDLGYIPGLGIDELPRIQAGSRVTQTMLIMKLTAIVLLTACLQVSAKSNGQNRITISVKNAPLEKIFEAIEKQSTYVVWCEKALLQGTIPVNLNVSNALVDQVLAVALKDQGLKYTIIEKVVVISRKQTQSEKLPNVAPNEYITTTGVVTDENRIPLSGATIKIKNGRVVALADQKGYFEIKNLPNNSVLEVSFTGYASEEIRVTSASTLNVVLRVAQTKLDEVHVVAYGISTQRLEVGSVSKVSSNEISSQPIADPLLALEGRVPGLYIQQTSGVPGAYSTVRIRGQNSLFNGNDPLYIVDGVPYSSTSLTSNDIGGGIVGTPSNGVGLGLSPFNSLNPGDIESIEILKDASATAIYGSRGANGVILITTKKGRAGHAQYDINLFSGIEKVTRTIKMLDTRQYLSMRHQAFSNDNETPTSTDYDINGFWDTTRYTNWQKVLIGNPSSFTNVQASISGGDSRTQFILGGGFSKQGTVFPGDYSDQKASGHISLTHASSDLRFHAQFSANYINNISHLPTGDFTTITTIAPDAPTLYNANGTLNWQIKDGTATWDNPLSANVLQADATTDNLITNLSLSYQIASGLSLKAIFGYNRSQMDQTIQTPAIANAPPDDSDPMRRTNRIANTNAKNWILEPQAEYRRKLAAGQIEGLLGTSYQQYRFSSSGLLYTGFGNDALISNPLAATSFFLVGNSASEYHYTAIFARIRYNWKDKYLLNFNARRDGSSRFGPGNQFGNFSSAGAAWILSKESFFQKLKFVSFAKIRGSYGTSGNDQIGDYQYISTYVPNGQIYQGASIIFPTGLSNPQFGWEQVRKLEIATELGFLADRILVSASFYRSRSNNQLIPYTLPRITGYQTVIKNFPASIENRGLEFTINTINIKSKDFSWTTTANLTVPRNKLLAFPGIDSSVYRNSYSVGHSLFSQFLYHYTGVNTQTGIYTVATKDPSGQPSYPDDLVLSKAITQKFYGGVQNSFRYKNIQLDVFIQFVNQTRLDRQSDYYSIPGTMGNQSTAVMNRWQKSGDHSDIQQFTQSPSNPAYNAYFNVTSSDYGITNASFVRLKNLALSFLLPSSWREKIHLQSARIYGQCQNLFTITKYQGIDPETGLLGLPPLKVLTIGLQIDF